jgi:hypothetical protein
MRAAERAKRDTQIYLAYVRGISHASFGRSYGLCARQIRRIVEEQRKSTPSPFEEDVAEHFEQHFEMCEVTISDLAQAAMEAPTHRGKVAAINAKVRLMHYRAQLMVRLGLLPTPDRLSQMSLETLSQMIRAVSLQHGASPELQDDLLTALSDWGQAHGVAPIWVSARRSDISTRENVRSRKSGVSGPGDGGESQ